MPIAVQCKCGKAFRAKDELAGKTVRCPGCQQPLAIPSAAPAPARTAAPAAKAAASKASDEALLKVEEARRKRAVDAETEAAERDEMNKLVAAWDQVAGKGAEPEKDKGKPKEKIGEKASKVTAVTKLQDSVGMMKQTLWWKYLIIVSFVLAGGAGSAYLITKVVTAGAEQVKPRYTKEDVPKLFTEARLALAAGRLEECREALAHIIRLEPHRVNNRDYVAIKEQLDKALQKK
jgi:hypothetical protein